VHKLKGQKIVIASHNQGKVIEIKDLLAPYKCMVQSAGDYNLDEPDETENTFEGNALLKARYVAEKTGEIALADDSGLSVDLLGGEPGIYSARWAGVSKNFDAAIGLVRKKIIDALGSKDFNVPITSSFYCALAIVFPDKTEDVMLGTVSGTLTFPPKGNNGFGYDPIFIADGYNITFGEMNPSEKHAISHRADAFKMLVERYF
jgi:XTP/dITP diphosphohydrolase